MTSSFARRPRRQLLMLVLWVALITIAAGTMLLPGCKNRESRSNAVQSAKPASYHCPMHPTVTSDKPGQCPICHMNLVPIAADSTSTDSAGGRSTS